MTEEKYNTAWTALEVYGVTLMGWILSMAFYIVLFRDNLDRLKLTAYNETLPVVMAQYLIIFCAAYPGIAIVAVLSNARLFIRDIKCMSEDVSKEIMKFGKSK